MSSRKPEPTYKHSYPYLALNAVDLYNQEIRSTWATSSHLAKVATLQFMAHLIESAIAQLEENSEQQQ